MKASKTSTKKRVHPNRKAVNEMLEELDISMSLLEPAHIDEAIVGISFETGQVIYDYDTVVRSFMKANKWTYEEAVEWVDYNTLRALPYEGDKAPIFIRSVKSWVL